MPAHEDKLVRVLAWLIRNEDVSPASIERAVTSAVNMKLGQSVPLTGISDDDETLRRTFVYSQAQRLK